MVKEIVKLLIVGSGCSGVAIVSTTFSGIDDSFDKLTGRNQRGEYKKIEKISSYGEIEAFDEQNGCVFRIVDETESIPKDYSLADFLATKKKDIPNLESEVAKVAESGRNYCGKEVPVMAIFYVTERSDAPKNAVKKVFKLKRGQTLINNHKSNP
ncbi:hypothetical protein A6V39_04540 [Candidatus Mycoplasma haematobovis]|uniref:Uncharacterized protein n=1 Tax=Candidatus Mycoplasma haematobovis TaxID=432608 RepID=A0A1A9QCH8_9MOLU|nr:hypothetical protein [Candidatus Mycoplasma haematobovis]OAL10153.1 hypothetical protein A6V39_04540 [Candidatus Mycoplasma haematobovis]